MKVALCNIDPDNNEWTCTYCQIRNVSSLSTVWMDVYGHTEWCAGWTKDPEYLPDLVVGSVVPQGESNHDSYYVAETDNGPALFRRLTDGSGTMVVHKDSLTTEMQELFFGKEE